MEARPREGVNVAISSVRLSKHGRKTVGREVCDLFHTKPDLRLVRLKVCNIASVHMGGIWCDNDDGICCRCVDIETFAQDPPSGHKCDHPADPDDDLCRRCVKRAADELVWLATIGNLRIRPVGQHSVGLLLLLLRATVPSGRLRLVHPLGGD